MAILSAATGIATPPSISAGSRPYRPDIDGLRALAILAVVLGHAHLPLLSGFTGGFTGVDIFFVISGYLIGGHIHAELRANNFSFLRFYQRRARRILPAFFAVLLFTIAAGLLLLSPSELARLARSAFAATLSASNILFWHGANYFDTRSELNPLLMTWSLGVEEQFYAVIPLAMVLLSRARRSSLLPAILAVSALSFLFSWIALGSYPSLAFYMLPARAWELGIGVALAVAEQNRKRGPLSSKSSQALSLAGLALMLAPLFLLNASSPFPGPAALPSAAGAALCIATHSSWLNRKLLSQPALTFVGRISYSWYLWHWPLLAFLRIVYGVEPPATITFTTLAISFAAAVLSYHFIEQPFRHSRRAPLPLLARYAVATAAILAGCAFLWRTHGAPQRSPALAQIESAATPLSSDSCLTDDGDDHPNLSPNCVQSSAPPQAVLALWGDSHAAAIAPGLRPLASAQGLGLIELAKASCPPTIGATHFLPRHPQLAAECLHYNAAVLDLLTHNPRIQIVVLSAAWAGYLHRGSQDGWLTASPAPGSKVPTPDAARSLLAHALTGAIQSLQAAGKQVIVFDEVPTFDFEPDWKIDTAQIPARRILSTLLRVPNSGDQGFAPPGDTAFAAESTAILQQIAAALPATYLVDLKSPLCDASAQCSYRIGGRLLYIDNNHLSPAGALFAIKDLHLPPLNSHQPPTGIPPTPAAKLQ